MKSRFLLDIVVWKSTAIFQLFTSEDETLLIGRDTFLILNLGLNVLNRVRGFNFKSDSLTSESLNEDLHASS